MICLIGYFAVAALAAVFALAGVPARAQGRLWVVDQRSAAADDGGEGTADRPFKTINAAARRAAAGDTVLVHAGIYRECVIPARGGEEGRPITYTAAPDEVVCVRGADMFAPAWQPLPGQSGLFTAPVNAEVFRTRLDNVPGHKTLGQVIVDDRMLDQVDDVEDLDRLPGTWITDGHSITVHFPAGVVDPARHQVEITVRRNAFRPDRRGLGYLVIRGFHFVYAANQSIAGFWEGENHLQSGLVSCRSGHHWVIENNSLCWANSVGLDVGMEKHVGQVVTGQPQPPVVGYHLIRNNVISDNGQGGICGIGHFGVQILGNRLERNNRLGFSTFEEAAIKVHAAYEMRIEGNLIRDNEAGGIWLDAAWAHDRITRNVIVNNAGFGIFCELGRGPCLVDNNIVAQARVGGETSGFYAHDASGVTVAHNLFIFNQHYGTLITRATNRAFGDLPPGATRLTGEWVNVRPNEVRDMKVLNNLYVDNGRGALCFPGVGPAGMDNISDYNAFIAGSLPTAFFVPNGAAGGKAGVPDVQAVLEAALTAEGAKAEAPPRLLAYQDGPLLTLEEWRLVTRQDLHSRFARVRKENLDTRSEPFFQFSLDSEAPLTMHCPSVPGVDRDFYGRPLPARNPLPGPFQEMQQSANLFRLTPGMPSETANSTP